MSNKKLPENIIQMLKEVAEVYNTDFDTTLKNFCQMIEIEKINEKVASVMCNIWECVKKPEQQGGKIENR